jgi:hypothetical protein
LLVGQCSDDGADIFNRCLVLLPSCHPSSRRCGRFRAGFSLPAHALLKALRTPFFIEQTRFIRGQDQRKC